MVACAWEAIAVDRSIVSIDKSECTQCGGCVSACPAGAIDSFDLSPEELSRRLSAYDMPVVGCRRNPHDSAHARVACLGYLSKDILLAVVLTLKRPLQLNAVNCADCSNELILDSMRKDLSKIDSLRSLLVPYEVKLVEDEHELDYEPQLLCRRDFFTYFRNTAKHKRDAVIEGFNFPNTSYRKKAVPPVRKVLNTVYSELDEHKAEIFLSKSYYGMTIESNCSGCALCVGLCPAGALTHNRADRTNLHTISFNTLNCSGCGLCAEACPVGSITLKKGFQKNRNAN